jgi:hypothetical protein
VTVSVTRELTVQWRAWGPSVRAADPADTLIDGTTVGRVHMPLVIGPPLRITHHEQGHFWSWWVAGIPATGHRIDALPEGRRITFEAPTTAFACLAVCRRALDRIEALTARAMP